MLYMSFSAENEIPTKGKTEEFISEMGERRIWEIVIYAYGQGKETLNGGRTMLVYNITLTTKEGEKVGIVGFDN